MYTQYTWGGQAKPALGFHRDIPAVRVAYSCVGRGSSEPHIESAFHAEVWYFMDYPTTVHRFNRK